jgi:hypothetical protein
MLPPGKEVNSLKKISLIEALAGKPSNIAGLKIESENTAFKAIDIGIFEGTSLAYVENASQFHVLPQNELWFRLQKK